MLQIFLIDGYFKGNQRQNHVLRQTQSTIYKKQSSNIDVSTFSGVKLPNSNFLRCDTFSWQRTVNQRFGASATRIEMEWNIHTFYNFAWLWLEPLVPMRVKESPRVVKVQMLSSWFFWISRMNIPKMNFFVRIWIFTNILNEFLWCYAFQRKW